MVMFTVCNIKTKQSIFTPFLAKVIVVQNLNQSALNVSKKSKDSMFQKSFANIKIKILINQ